MLKSFLIRCRAHPELIILALVVMIIAMLVIPLPTYIIDLLIGMNMVLAILIFMSSFYVERVLSFSSFPSVLLISTLFRLALSISTSRLILLEADAGEIISSFGNFVIGDSLAVGFVVFSIVTIVQFIVITKGSERVAEVAARFSLDGMPGKQMSIDADLRAGIIEAEMARQKRSDLERESQLYGAFDGAMKFIKGDAIANIIIIFINIIGGLSVGVGQRDMDFSDALSVYTILTVGDGLVSQIPALLISVSAGFIVTRVDGDGNNMGESIVSQLMGNGFAIMVTAVLAVGIGLLPGFPLVVFFLLAGILGTYFYFRFGKSKPGIRRELATGRSTAGGELLFNEGESELGIIDGLDYVMTETVPLVLILSPQRAAELQRIKLSDRIRSQFFIEYGLHIPDVLIREGADTGNDEVIFLLNEVRADNYIIPFEKVRLLNFPEDILPALHIQPTHVTRGEENYYWVAHDEGEQLRTLGYVTISAVDELYKCLSVYLAHNISEFFGIQETKKMLDQMDIKFPDLLKEVLRYITMQRIAEVLQRLVQERISVRNLRLIMEVLAAWVPREKDIVTLVEHVRGGLARYICHKFSSDGELKAIVLSNELEDTFREAVRPTATGNFLNLEPDDAEAVIEVFRVKLSNMNIPLKEIVLLTSVDIRRYVKKFIEVHYRDLEVLSYGELTDTISVSVLKTL